MFDNFSLMICSTLKISSIHRSRMTNHILKSCYVITDINFILYAFRKKKLNQFAKRKKRKQAFRYIIFHFLN